MGQKKPVTIYRLVSEGTIEEGMMVVAQDKLNLEREVTSNEGGIVYIIFYFKFKSKLKPKLFFYIV